MCKGLPPCRTKFISPYGSRAAGELAMIRTATIRSGVVILTLYTGALLTACGGGGGSTPSAAQLPQASQSSADSASTLAKPVFTNWHINAAAFGGAGQPVEEFNEYGNLLHPTGAFANTNTPTGMLYDPHNGLIYVANYSGPVTAYDKEGNQQPLSGGFPNALGSVKLAYNQRNHLIYALITSPPGIAVYDESGTPQKVSGTFPHLGAAGSNFTYDDHNGWLYYVGQATNGDYVVKAYDAGGHEMALRGFVNPFQTNLVYDPHNGFIYTVGETIRAFNEQGDAQTLSPGFPSDMGGDIAFDPHDNLIYATKYPTKHLQGKLLTKRYDEEGNDRTIYPFDFPQTPILRYLVVVH